MDFATFIGLITGITVMGVAIFIGPSAGLFLNLPGALIVLGGTFAAVMMKFSLIQFGGAIHVAVRAFRKHPSSEERLLEELIEIAHVARKQGLLALEEHNTDHELLGRGIRILVDGSPPELLQDILDREVSQAYERHERGYQIFQAIGDTAPAMGMIGTLIGLIQMLANMGNPDTIGPAMAVALLTTLYGALLANMIALPIADKLRMRAEDDQRMNAMVRDGIVAVQAGHNPLLMREMLRAYLPGSRRPPAEGAPS